MDKTTRILEGRLRQLHALDRNALEIYSGLARVAPDPETAETLRRIAADEARHVRHCKRILTLLGMNT